jgi:MHS family proline/betaine transporter-like MFS transporter
MTSAREVEVVATKSASPKQATKEHLSHIDVLWKILPAAGGSFIEWYEFAIYSYLSSYITDNFFANRGGSLGTWAGFAITFAFRPLGGAVFGYFADRVGRKPAMQLTIGIMLFATIGQGCLPTFTCCGESWGWFGLVLLLIFRALQGLSAGGELSTAAVYITEVSPPANLGFNLSWISVSGTFGAWSVAALVVFGIERVLSPEQMMRWGWRLPYLTSILPGLLLIIGRQSLQETTDFEELVNDIAESKTKIQMEGGTKGDEYLTKVRSPFAEVFAEYRLALVVGSFGTAGIGALWYVLPVYGPLFIQRFDGLPVTAITFSQMVAYLIPTILAPFFGVLIDTWGARKIHVLALVAGCVLAPGPLFYWWTHTPPSQAVIAVFAGQCIVGVLQAMTTAVYAWLVELFPVRVRATGVSVAYNIGIGIFGGLGPLISDAGNDMLDPRSLVSVPAGFTIFAGLLSLLAVGASSVLARRSMMKLTHIREVPY